MTIHVLDALGNPVRRDILRALRAKPLAVNEIAAAFPITRPAISRHLQILEEADLVKMQPAGARNLYTVRVEGFASVREFLDEFWDTALARLKELTDG